MAVCSDVKTISSNAFVYITHESRAILFARQKIRICEWIFIFGHRTKQHRHMDGTEIWFAWKHNVEDESPIKLEELNKLILRAEPSWM